MKVTEGERRDYMDQATNFKSREEWVNSRSNGGSQKLSNNIYVQIC
jgi:hypothetical protein